MKYFAYGSNMNPERMRNRRVKFLKREHAILKGYKLVFNKISTKNPMEGYANIIEDDKEVVEGVLYEMKEDELKNLDEFEGYPNHYTRKKVNVILENGQTVEAITYIAKPDKTREGLKPSKEYLKHLLKGCDLLSKEYCEKLRKVETLD
ncbi:MAG: gamma-glutamylcyclotransferase family protein [Candidatus Aenigmatarchaeota archaeon]